MIAIVVSRADRASEHIRDRLLELDDWDVCVDESRPDADGGGTVYRRPGAELRTFEDLHIHLDDPTPAFGTVTSAVDEANGSAPSTPEDREPGLLADREPELLVFVSRHAGETGPLLTAHFTGNFGPAEYGGDDGALARAAPAAQKRLVAGFTEHAPADYDVGIECTHHGPSETAVPSLFAELGSDDDQWDDPAGARAVARAVSDLIDDFVTGRSADSIDAANLLGDDGVPRHVVGFGGGHYAPRFTRIVEETAWGVGHIGSDWQLAELGSPAEHADVVERAFTASAAEYAVIEGDRPTLRETIDDRGYRVVGETWVRAVGDRPLALVERLEAAIATVSDGLRFGDVVPESPDSITVRELPADLISRAQGIDHETTRAVVERHTVAFETEESGTRAAGKAAFAPDGTDADAADTADDGDNDAADGYDVLVRALADVLRERFDEVTLTADAVVASEAAFDPELAAEHGVPEGPKFGRLTAGDAVEVDGRTVTPEDVTRDRDVRFPR
ncbi:D-aminoacyl-tRNA deacylase [Halopenitus malekzadehii]|uniref:D-aminoacyl-tRNA deacylase n=1 Tax=Halopenitus malekzadehii TaxID=1267564 RepID=A0A1H6HYW5_9EURY|nr:D-aminoacyl-tRNA deacylase [Halopenitus malekzadehii]SEH39388.1 D-aminoacyl-tRNA deacylase [Halopenitus malekzadehii]